jgi:hypothetical protein
VPYSPLGSGLLTFAPRAIGQAVGPPGAFGVVLLGHLEVMPATPALRDGRRDRLGGGLWRLCWGGERCQELLEPGEYLLFVIASEGHLQAIPGEGDVAVHRGGGFGQGGKGHALRGGRACSRLRSGQGVLRGGGLRLLGCAVGLGGEAFCRQGGRPLADPKAEAVAVDARVTPRTSASKPCVRVSPHTAPQLRRPCHGHVACPP